MIYYVIGINNLLLHVETTTNMTNGLTYTISLNYEKNDNKSKENSVFNDLIAHQKAFIEKISNNKYVDINKKDVAI